MEKETRISILICVLLAGIGAAVFIKQYDINPAVLTVQQVTPKAAGSGTAESGPAREVPIPIPTGMASMTPSERFSPDTLYEKINGKAELYLSAGFKNLTCQRMTSKVTSDSDARSVSGRDSEMWMEVFIYDMNTNTNAFAVYSRQRRNEGIALEISEFSYRTKNAVFFTHGPYYVEVIGSLSEDEMLQYMYDFANRFIKKVPVETKKKTEFDLFPQKGLVQKSISMIPSNAFGYEKLDNIYIAPYKLGDKQATLFISNRNTKKDAEELSEGYKDFLITFGGKRLEYDSGVENAFLIEIFGTYELFFTKETFFCGVHESGDIETAKVMAVNLINSLNSKISHQ